MNKDIRLNVGFWDHWKTVVLIADLGLEAAVGLQRLWCFAAQFKPDGRLSNLSARSIELSARWAGTPGMLVNKLLELGFLEKEGSLFVLHDWEQWNGYAAHAQERSDQARKGAEARWAKHHAGSNAGSNAGSSATCNAPSPDPSPAPSPTPDPDPDPDRILGAGAPETRTDPAPMPADSHDDTEHFEQCWTEYPKRAGNNPKRAALAAWKARRKAGVDARSLLEGTRRYRHFCDATGKSGTEYVMQGERFYGPKQPFEQDWSPPQTGPPHAGNGQGQRLSRNEQRAEDRRRLLAEFGISDNEALEGECEDISESDD